MRLLDEVLLGFSALAAVAGAHPYFAHEGELPGMDTSHLCKGKYLEIIQASMPLVVDLAKLAMTNTNQTLHQLWWGACSKDVVDKVYQQIVEWYPDNDNWLCYDDDSGMCGSHPVGITQPVGEAGGQVEAYSALCHNAFHWPGYASLDDYSTGYVGSMLHEISHHMYVAPDWGVDDGPQDMGGKDCYNATCIQASAQRNSDCQNAHIAEAYEEFAIAVNFSSPNPVHCDLPSVDEWTGIPPGYDKGLPQVTGTQTGGSDLTVGSDTGVGANQATSTGIAFETPPVPPTVTRTARGPWPTVNTAGGSDATTTSFVLDTVTATAAATGFPGEVPVASLVPGGGPPSNGQGGNGVSGAGGSDGNAQDGGQSGSGDVGSGPGPSNSGSDGDSGSRNSGSGSAGGHRHGGGHHGGWPNVQDWVQPVSNGQVRR